MIVRAVIGVGLTTCVALTACSGTGGQAASSSVPPTSSTGAPSSSSAPVPTPSPSTTLDLYAGSHAAVAPQGSVTEHTIRTADGLDRSYRLFVPSGGLGVAPLLVALHGGLGSGAQFEVNSDFDGLATSNRFIVAYPDGVGLMSDGSGGARTWNGGDCCGPAVKRNVDDVAFLGALVLDVSESNAIDPNRVYATGHSNGGIMALRLACEASDMFAAVGVQSAALGVQQCAPKRPVSLMQIHGTSDTNIPLSGGVGSGLSRVSFRPPQQAAEAMAEANGCSTPPVTTTDSANPDLIEAQWPSCSRGSAVSFLAVTGAGHAWMGHSAASAAGEKLVGPPYPDLDSSRALWAFLAEHPRT